jgi:hypothetical protein
MRANAQAAESSDAICIRHRHCASLDIAIDVKVWIFGTIDAETERSCSGSADFILNFDHIPIRAAANVDIVNAVEANVEGSGFLRRISRWNKSPVFPM